MKNAWMDLSRYRRQKKIGLNYVESDMVHDVLLSILSFSGFETFL